MKYANLCLAFAIAFAGCVTYPSTGKHVVLKGDPVEQEKIAKKVLAALPIQEVRKQVQNRFPELSSQQLERIGLSYDRMSFYDEARRPDGTFPNPPRVEVHIVVTVNVDRKLSRVRDAVAEFVESIVREKLKHRTM